MMDANSIPTCRTDWSKCCLCQEEKKNEFLISPLGSFQRTQDYAGYSNIVRNVPLFHAINDMPIAINPSRLDEGDGIEATLIRKQAKYHNSCRLLFNNSKLERAQNRSRALPGTSDLTDKPRIKRQKSDTQKLECFFCEEQDDISNLSEGMTAKLEWPSQSMCQNSEWWEATGKVLEML